MQIHRLFWLSIPLICSLSAVGQPVGRVTKFSGDWQDSSKNPPGAIQNGTEINHDGKLRRASGRSSDDFIETRAYFRKDDKGNDENVAFKCSEAAICLDRSENSRYLDLKRLEPASNSFRQFWQWVKDPQNWTPTLSWKIPEPDTLSSKLVVASGVAAIKHGRVSFTKVLAKAPEGLYEIKWCEALVEGWTPDTPTASCKPARVELQWKKGEVGEVAYSDNFDFGPGLYTVSVRRFARTPVGPAKKRPPDQHNLVYVLAAPPQQEDSIEELYQEALEITSKWSDTTLAERVRVAYLQHLSLEVR